MLKIEHERLLVAVVLTLIISIDMINTSMLEPILPHIPSKILLFGVVLLGLRLFNIRQYSKTYLLFAPLLLLSGVMIYFNTGFTKMLMHMMMLVFLYGIDIEYVLKIYSRVCLFFVLLIVILSILGIIPNLQFLQARSAGMIVRNSFGFLYPTDFASHCFYLYTALSYLFRKRFIILRTLSGFLLAGFVIYYCDARLNAASIVTITVVFLYFYYFESKEWRLFAIMPYTVGVVSTVMIYLSSTFTWSRSFYVVLNKFSNMRLHLGHEALKKYPVQLFGTRGISFVGYGGQTGKVQNYDYVDSSYVQMLFTYGIIPVVLLVCLYMVQSWEIYRKKNYLLLTCLALVAVNCIFEAFWIRPSYNIFMFLLFASIPTMEFDGENSEMRKAV